MMYNKRNLILVAVFTILMCLMCVYNHNQYNLASQKINVLQANLSKETQQSEELIKELSMANNMLDDLKNVEYELVYIGEYKISHYCVEKYEHICGTGSGKTATGTYVTSGRTIAVDPSVIPYGSEVYIDGYGWRVAEDCGGAVKGKHIDVAVNTHNEAMDRGIKHTGVWLLIKKS